jgi:hypothetical protein
MTSLFRRKAESGGVPSRGRAAPLIYLRSGRPVAYLIGEVGRTCLARGGPHSYGNRCSDAWILSTRSPASTLDGPQRVNVGHTWTEDVPGAVVLPRRLLEGADHTAHPFARGESRAASNSSRTPQLGPTTNWSPRPCQDWIEGRGVTSNYKLERSGKHRGPRLTAATRSWPPFNRALDIRMSVIAIVSIGVALGGIALVALGVVPIQPRQRPSARINCTPAISSRTRRERSWPSGRSSSRWEAWWRRSMLEPSGRCLTNHRSGP